MERTFGSKKELAEALLGGQKWIVKGVKGFCCFQEENNIRTENKIPFKFINEIGEEHDIDLFWSCADNQTIWEKIK